MISGCGRGLGCWLWEGPGDAGLWEGPGDAGAVGGGLVNAWLLEGPGDAGVGGPL